MKYPILTINKTKFYGLIKEFFPSVKTPKMNEFEFLPSGLTTQSYIMNYFDKESLFFMNFTIEVHFTETYLTFTGNDEINGICIKIFNDELVKRELLIN